MRFLYFGKKSKELYEQGDKTQLLHMLNVYISTHRPIPDWLGQAFTNAYRMGATLEIKSWDEVFGRPLPLKKGERWETKRRNEKIAFLLMERVWQHKKAGKRIDKGLFERVGKDLGMSGTVASDLYYQAIKEFEAAFGESHRKLMESIDRAKKSISGKIKNNRDY